jgi:NAD(P)-dependent dehydrogenase (short-subunit alcohol dehydrogenase family)
MSTKGRASGEGLLAGRVALVSGAARGIGFAIAEMFQCEGARVFLLDCDAEAGSEAERRLTARCAENPAVFLEADLLKEPEIHAAIDAVRASAGRLNLLVNNAAIEFECDFAELTTRDWDLVLNVNLRGAFLLTQSALPLFPREGGAIVNISSIHAGRAFPGSLPYSCAKAGLVAMTRNLALELSPRHIRVNSISPGYIDTRLWDEYLKHVPDPDRVATCTTALHPVGRRGTPEDVAEAALYLANGSSSFVTGTNLVVDGGLTIRAHHEIN